LPVENAWDELFNLENYQELRRRRLGRGLAELFEYGMELENVAEVAPAALIESLDKMESLARGIIVASAPREQRQRVRKSA
jgi:predicted transcriptional regulator